MNNLITSGILKNCDSIYDIIGVDKDLILVNYVDFNVDLTLSKVNKVLESEDINYKGISRIILNANAQTYFFNGSYNSVAPTITPELREDNKMRYSHEITFIAYSKTAEDRKMMESLSKSKVIAITKDLSTGLYELFGAKVGLTFKSISRQYSGAQNSNFYSITLGTADTAILKEDTMGELSEKIILSTDLINTQEFTFNQGDSQIFETSADSRYLCTISINGINIEQNEYEILSENQVKIIKPLFIGDLIILNYSYEEMKECEELVWNGGVSKLQFISNGVDSTFDLTTISKVKAVFWNGALLDDDDWYQSNNILTLTFTPANGEIIKPI